MRATSRLLGIVRDLEDLTQQWGSEYDVFLSHKADDKAEVELLGARLKEQAGLRPFLDKWHLVQANRGSGSFSMRSTAAPAQLFSFLSERHEALAHCGDSRPVGQGRSNSRRLSRHSR
jgi:hypothetical protein